MSLRKPAIALLLGPAPTLRRLERTAQANDNFCCEPVHSQDAPRHVGHVHSEARAPAFPRSSAAGNVSRKSSR